MSTIQPDNSSCNVVDRWRVARSDLQEYKLFHMAADVLNLS